jgi:predicted anti-sigma-YlaC factor YlaD
MTCRKAKQLLKDKDREGYSSADYAALTLHLKSCPPCGKAMQIARLSSALLQTLREETEPGPTFYHQLRARLAKPEIGRPDISLLQAWGFARRLIPALAMGVLLLAGVTLQVGGSHSSLPVQVRDGTAVYAFSLEEVNLPGVVGQPSRDQMLAFVLRQDDVRGPSSSLSPSVGERRGEGEVRDGLNDRNAR